jgi:hypothetical protein
MMASRETKSVYMTLCCKVKPLEITAKTLPKKIGLKPMKTAGWLRQVHSFISDAKIPSVFLSQSRMPPE